MSLGHLNYPKYPDTRLSVHLCALDIHIRDPKYAFLLWRKFYELGQFQFTLFRLIVLFPLS